MLKIAIVGCGKIADAHAEQIQHVADCRIVAVCDREPLMARQLAERFKVENAFEDLTTLLKATAPDVVHITTPPASHHSVARQCLEFGANVYVEKPFTLNTAEAEELMALAQRKGLKVTVGHDLQFSHVTRSMRRLIAAGYLGGPPVHLESYYCYDLRDSGYAQALLGDKQHWVRRLPGKLLQNIISHGIARIAEYFPDDDPTVIAHGYASPVLRKLGESEIIDELRVIISDNRSTTAYFTFSSQMRPALNYFRIYGPKNGLLLDQEQETLLKLRGDPFKSYVEKFVPQWITAQQCMANSARNIRLFLKRDFPMKAGMRKLIELFYQSIVTNSPPPIPYKEILLVSRIMDRIFDQLRSAGHAFQDADEATTRERGYVRTAHG